MDTQYPWQFREKRKGDDIQNPISGEFFADGSLKNVASGLVREALQNALDAKPKTATGPVRVRIAICRDRHSLAAADANRWFGSLRDHLQADDNGLASPPTIGDSGDPCAFLVIEDFNTSGLTGDIESDDADGMQNNFVDFLRSDGQTRKVEGDRGSWGVGKNVFPRSSRINGFLAYTVRRDDGLRLLMGKSILKIRRTQPGGPQWQPSCYLAASWNNDDVPRPFGDKAMVEQIRTDFGVTRQNEPGLSIVIPWLDDDIDAAQLRLAILSEFYFAILAGDLIVDLAEGSEAVALSDETVVKWAGTLTEDPDLKFRVALAAWALTDPEPIELVAPPANGKQKWDEAIPLQSDETRQKIASSLANRDRIAVKVPLHTRSKSQDQPVPTHFHVFLEHDASPNTKRPVFFRNKLAISGVKRALGAPKVRSLVVIDDGPLADLLRAAEPPNHTDWDSKTANLKKHYAEGNHVITFVKEAVRQIVAFARDGDEKPDADLAIDFFSKDESGKGPTKKKAKKTAPGNDPQPTPDLDLTPKPNRFIIDEANGGFALRSGDPDATPPKCIRVEIAYDTLSGNPMKQFDPADFDLTKKDKSGIKFAFDDGVSGYDVLAPNSFEVKIDSVPFELFVTGFDTNRDLKVQARAVNCSADAEEDTERNQKEADNAVA